MKILFLVCIIIVIFIINILVIIKKLGIKKDVINNIKLNTITGDNNIDFRINEIKFTKNKYQREISFQNDINYIYWLSVNYKFLNNKTNILGAYFTKWYKDGAVKIIDENNRFSRVLTKLKNKGIIDAVGINGNSLIKNKIYIKFEDKFVAKDILEDKLFKIMKDISIDRTVNEDYFIKWLNKNSDLLIEWFNELYNAITINLINREMIIFTDNNYVVSDTILNDAIGLNNYKNFLMNFNNFNEKEIKDVHLYDNYFLTSVLLGINKNIKEELGNIYPTFLFDIKNILSKLNDNIS